MSIRKLLETAPLNQLIQADKIQDYQQKSIPYTGAPRKHPYDPEKMLLFAQPFSSHTKIYEFRIDDICHIDEMPSIGTKSGENLTVARVWVKKGSLGIQYEPFEVQETPKFFKDSELLHQVMGEMD